MGLLLQHAAYCSRSAPALCAWLPAPPATMPLSHCVLPGRLQLGKRFQRPEGMAGATGGVEQYARAQYMLQNLGLQVRLCHA